MGGRGCSSYDVKIAAEPVCFHSTDMLLFDFLKKERIVDMTARSLFLSCQNMFKCRPAEAKVATMI